LKEKAATQPDPEDLEDETETGPLRRCLVLRDSFAREAMLRFVVGPEAAIVFDAAATLPGRGHWLSAQADVIQKAVKLNVFSRAARQRVTVAPDLAAQVETLLRRRLIDLLGLARRGGGAISGFEKAREWLAQGKAGLVVQAADGSAEERARFIGGRDVPVVTVLDAASLGKVFGREHTVHAVVASGKLARMIEIDAARLAGVAGGETSGQ
jgi:predicted RNA-binding protein YlxR (DUF448 family)/ribosomal protein L30E